MTATILQNPSRLRLQIRVQPRAARNRVAGRHGEALKVQVAAPPVDGAANAALVEFLAEALGVRRADVQIIMGEHGRTKVVDILTSDPTMMMQRIEGLLPSRDR